MAERIIPINVEGRDTSPDRESSPASDKEEKSLSKSLEELSVESKPLQASQASVSHSQESVILGESQPCPTTLKRVRVKPAPKASSSKLEDLKGFDVLEKRDANLVLSDYSLPNSDVLEKILLVIDRAQDENYTPFIIGSQKYTPLSMVKRAIGIFIKLKLGINPYHEFAIIVMNENNSQLVMEFTNDTKKLMDCLNHIEACETEDIFDLETVFNIIEDVTLPEPQESGMPPPFILRTILFYGRSYTVPQFTMSDKISKLFSHPFFICDVLMTHEAVESDNNCQKIFDILQNLDQKGIAYFFPVCRDLRRMHKYTAKLLGHPLQRPIQKLIKN